MKANTALMENTVALSVTFRSPSNKRKVSTDYVQSDADKAMLHLSKDLLDSDEYREIKRVERETFIWLRRRCLPSLFRRGVYLCLIERLDEINDRLERAEKIEHPKAVEKFFDTYPQRVTEARERLGEMFDPEDYPPVEALKYAFGVSYQYISFDVPGKLQTISKKLYQEQREKVAKRMEEGATNILWLLRESVGEMVAYMVKRLTEKDDEGKTKAIRKNSPMVDRWREFLDDFGAKYALVKNAAGQDENDPVEELLGKAKKIMKGVDAERLRGDEALRTSVGKGFEQLKTALESILVKKPTRAISLEDE